MKKSEVNVETLLNQLSEEKINRVVDANVVKAGWSSHSYHSSSCESRSFEPHPVIITGGVAVGVGLGLRIGI